ncbi:hypothetical protein CEV08_06795 [Bartonella tribocorum]|uniref:Uncharacterized protein n=1 Tax=Bartonella tribocorum TaxID=85701 RepID=A0A2M6USJ7_9HYPH|nr:hypothetical protein CEV08_06795 [Bartonella tribocorum]
MWQECVASRDIFHFKNSLIVYYSGMGGLCCSDMGENRLFNHYRKDKRMQIINALLLWLKGVLGDHISYHFFT